MFRALISVSDKAGIEQFALGLRDIFGADLMLLSTGKTAAVLKAAGTNPTEIVSFTRSPEVMGGRVKTLHPKIYGGILARRDQGSDMEELANVLMSAPIDLVCVSLYPFERTAKNPNATFEDLIENIDIGGTSLIRAAAKNFRHVLVVTSPDHYSLVIRHLKSPGGLTLRFRFRLMQDAFARTAEYDNAIAEQMERWETEGFNFERIA